MKISGKPVGQGSDAFVAADMEESKAFVNELVALCEKHGLILVPQSREYKVSFHTPMRVVPLSEEIMNEVKKSWVVFEE